MVKWGHFLLSAFMLAVISCSSSDIDNELSWYSKYTVPLTNKSFYVSDLLKEIVIDTNFFISDPDTGGANLGDTFDLHIIKSDLKSYESVLFNSDNININYKFSELSLKDLPLIIDTVEIGLSDEAFLDSIFELKYHIISKLFKKIDFDSLDNFATLKIENLSDSVYLKDLSLIIESVDTVLLLDGYDSLNSNSSIIKEVNLSNFILNDSINYKILFNGNKNSTSLDSLKLSISLDLNGLSFDKADILDKYIDYEFEQLIYVPVTVDGFNLQYVDVDKINLPIIIKNPFPFGFNGTVEISSMFDINSQKQGIFTEPLFQTDKRGLDLNIDANNSGNSFKESVINVKLNNKRIYCDWDPLLEICYVPVIIAGKIKSEGVGINVSDEMEIGIRVENPEVKIAELKGSYQKPAFVIGKNDDFDMPLTDLEKVLTVIRDKVKLVDNKLSVELEFLMPDSSTLSDVKYWCIMMMYADSTVVEDTLTWEMKNIKGGDINKYEFEVNSMVNAFPDSIKYRIDYEFPEGSIVHLTDTLFKNEGGKSSVEMNVNFNLELTSSLVWEITDKVSFDLGVMNVPMAYLKESGGAILDEKVLFTELDVLNQTNFSGQLLALGSEVDNRMVLEELSIDTFTEYFESISQDSLFIPILGNSAIELPARGEKRSDQFHLLGNIINSVIESDTISLRFALIVFPSQIDALKDTDFIALNSSVTLEGVMSTDKIDQ